MGATTYLVRNLWHLLPLALILAFSVLLVVSVVSVLRGMRESAYRYIEEFRRCAVVFPKGETKIDDAFRGLVTKPPSVERAFEARNCVIRVKTLVGPLPFHVRGIAFEDRDFYLSRMGVELVRGRLPAIDAPEVALHEDFLKANGWDIGSAFGWDVDDEDWMPGRFDIVGILHGPTPCGIASLEYLKARYPYAPKLWERLLVFPRSGRMGEMGAYLRSVENLKSWDYARARSEVDDMFSRILLIVNSVCVLLIAVIAAVAGLLQNIFFTQRTDEFALFLAVGVPRRRLLRKALVESSYLLGLSWLSGIGLSLALLGGFNAWVLDPMALSIPAMQLLPLCASALLPMGALLVGGLTVAARLSRFDPVLMIERRK